MSNRFPLVIDSATNRILELPAGDNLDLASSNISNVVSINSTGNVNAQFFNGNGSALTGIVASSATTAVTVTGNAQPNITSTGTLTSLTVSGTGNIANVTLTKFNEQVASGGFVNTGTTISPNVAAATIFRYTANSNFTFTGFTSGVAGSSATLIIVQDATGSRTLTVSGVAVLWAGGSKTLSTASGSVDVISIFYDGSYYWASLTKGYA